MHNFDYFAACPKGLEYLLVDELKTLGGHDVHEGLAGVYFSGDAALGYRVCLWSRLASRVLLIIAGFDVLAAESLYEGVAQVDWSEHLDPNGTFAIDVSGKTAELNHSQYVAQLVKDAIVDQCRRVAGVRPSVQLERPGVKIHLLLKKQRASLSIDMAGSALFHRGYRVGTGDAPLAENLAAALLLRAHWPQIYASGGDIVDPLCGAGTLLIEAALMAANAAPGLKREYFGFVGWRGFDSKLWQTLKSEAQEKSDQGLKHLRNAFFGFDHNAAVLGAAKANAHAAGLGSLIQWQHQSLDSLVKPSIADSGLVITNPPYGERMGQTEELKLLYASLGQKLKQHFSGWRAAVITSSDDLAFKLGMRANRHYAVFNGALACKLWCFDSIAEKSNDVVHQPKPLSDGAIALRNRLEKNIKKLKSWLRRENVTCWRVYDADLPEYAAAIDNYEGWIHIQEYAPPATIPQETARKRLGELIRVVCEVFDVSLERIAIKQRRPQMRKARYQRVDEREELITVQEAGLKFAINLFDYIDTGLFLDHRPVRAQVKKIAKNKRFLNLFCYTGSASVYAVAGGAVSTTSVDLSAVYLEWAARNFELNDFQGKQHQLVQADVLSWLGAETQMYDLIFVDPPTFSNSKRADDFDVQKDHVRLLQLCAQRLAKDGVILFSTNYRKFRLDRESLSDFDMADLSASSIPPDFRRDQRIHYCYEIRYKAS
jgi:23S rRNA (guanine2445-N2)-methyltransferase / 23S rRNA (guanine2069-N7)-methyltransferase